MRPLIHGGELDDAHIAGIVRELSLEPAVIPRLHQYVRQHSLLIDAGATEWTAVMLQEFYESSWFTFGGSHRIASVRGGTRPGDNLADIVFTFLFAEVSKKIRSRLSAAGIRLALPWAEQWLCGDPDDSSDSQGDVSPLDVTWMDDLAVLLCSRSPATLVEDLRTARLRSVSMPCFCPTLGRGKLKQC